MAQNDLSPRLHRTFSFRLAFFYLIGPLLLLGISCGLLAPQDTEQVWEQYLDPTEAGVPLLRRAIDMTADRGGNLWVASSYGGVVLFYDKERETWQEILTPLMVSGESIYVAHTGDVWLGTRAGLGRLRADDGSWDTYGVADGLANEDVRAILIDDTGRIWVGTGGGGVFTSEDDGATWQHVFIAEGFSEFTVRDIFRDSQGEIWVLGGDLWRYRPAANEWQPYLDRTDRLNTIEGWVTPDPTLITLDQGSVFSVAESADGIMWFGAADYIYAYDPQMDTWRTYQIDDRDPHNTVRSLAFDADGNLWLGTLDGAFRFSPESGQVVEVHDETNGYTTVVTKSIVPMSDGSIWFATFGDGVFKYEPEE